MCLLAQSVSGQQKPNNKASFKSRLCIFLGTYTGACLKGTCGSVGKHMCDVRLLVRYSLQCNGDCNNLAYAIKLHYNVNMSPHCVSANYVALQ